MGQVFAANNINKYLRTKIFCKMFIIYLIFQIAVRIGLFIYSHTVASFAPMDILRVFGLGVVYDGVAFLYSILLLMMAFFFMRTKFSNRKIGKIIIGILIYLFFLTMIFIGVAEYFFWDEFQTKFNFITVDYLIYTTELFANIFQSYNMPVILSSTLLSAIIPTFYICRMLKDDFAQVSISKRLIKAAIYIAVLVVAYISLDSSYREKVSINQYDIEISGNGPYEFVHAYFNNELNYDRFYLSYNNKDVLKDIRKELLETGDTYLDENSINRHITNTLLSTNKDPNVVFIVVESLSASYMQSFGGDKNYTPYLDKLSQDSYIFTNAYATGTRTVRGLEALSICVPPTPGQSILRRPENSDMCTIGSILRKDGYETKFLYGGNGFFDNMNAFFANNGYSVVDKKDIPKEEVFFENAWGVADEILFSQSIKYLDKAYSDNKPIFQLIMTTTNHRPYTFPTGKIDEPQGQRQSVVKYTDWAINDLIERSRSKPWFDNTIFVIVADHNANVAGKIDLPIDRYKIPVIIYAPKLISKGKSDRLMSQIDVVPTLLGMMGKSYDSSLMGYDMNKLDEGKERAFISTYQLLGYVRNDKLVILSPNKKVTTYKINDSQNSDYTLTENEEGLTKEAISWYQGASYLYKNKLLK